MSASGPLVSVIVPVYNQEAYIARCLSALLNQTYGNYEVIIVDDGSSDMSHEVIHRYQQKYDKLSYFYKDNGGVSSARNLGMDLAKGTYLVFIDSDDWVVPDMLERMVDCCVAHNAELVICDYCLVIASQINKIGLDIAEGIVDNSTLKGLIIESDQLNSPCTKMYRLDIVRKYGIRFPEQLRVGEDQIFNMRYITKVQYAHYLPMALYYYSLNHGSSCRTIHSNQLDMLIEQERLRQLIIAEWKMLTDENRVKSAIWFLQNVCSYCFLAARTERNSFRIILHMINNAQTKCAINIARPCLAKSGIKMFRYMMPAVMTGNVLAVFVVSKILSLLFRLKELCTSGLRMTKYII